MTDALIVFSASYLYLLPVVLFIGYGFVTHRKREFVLYALLVLPVSFILSRIAGHLFYNPRPFVVDPSLVPLIHHGTDNGFPSDHALLTGTLAAIVTPFSGILAAVLWVLALIVGGARVLAHVHHTLDIVGSYVIAAGSAAVLYPLTWKLQAPFDRVLARFGIRATQTTSQPDQAP